MGPGAGVTVVVVVVGQGEAAWGTAQWGDLVPTLPHGPLPAHSSPCAFPASAPPKWVPLHVNSVLFSLLFSLCIFIFCSLPSFAFFLPYLPLFPLYVLPFLDLSFLTLSPTFLPFFSISFLILPSLSFLF